MITIIITVITNNNINIIYNNIIYNNNVYNNNNNYNNNYNNNNNTINININNYNNNSLYITIITVNTPLNRNSNKNSNIMISTEINPSVVPLSFLQKKNSINTNEIDIKKSSPNEMEMNLICAEVNK